MPPAEPTGSEIRVGLVGAGPWATQFHAPMIGTADGVRLTAVWARRPSAAAALATPYGAESAASFDDLLDGCDAVAFAVPPDVQAALAPRAADAGKHLLLEKPLAFDLGDAERLTAAVERAGVASLIMLRFRFDPVVQAFLTSARGVRPRAVLGRFVTGGALPPATFATPWRIERGALLDLAPHVVDLAEQILGPVAHVRAAGDPTRWVALTTVHGGGTVGQFALSLTTPGTDDGMHLEVVHDAGSLMLGDLPTDLTGAQRSLMATFVESVRTGTPNPLDVRRGLELQRVIAAAEQSLAQQP
jgi:predicted dehydrogenase